MVADVKDEETLRTLYRIVSRILNSAQTDWWDSLPVAVQQELSQAIDESLESDQWATDEEVKAVFTKWRN